MIVENGKGTIYHLAQGRGWNGKFHPWSWNTKSFGLVLIFHWLSDVVFGRFSTRKATKVGKAEELPIAPDDHRERQTGQDICRQFFPCGECDGFDCKILSSLLRVARAE